MPTQKRTLPSCPTKNCISCDNAKSECDQCDSGYLLHNKRCYSTDCEIYGDCKYCTEFDCIQCNPGFKVSYGFCEESEDTQNKRNLFILSIGLIVIAIFTIIGSIILIIRKKRKYRRIALRTTSDCENVSNNLQEMVTPNSAKNGNFIIINPKNSNIIVNNNNISLNNSDANDNKNESNSDILKNILKCALCDNIEIVALSNCGCPLCKTDNDLITKKIILCPTHKKELKRGIQFPKKKEEIITHLDDKGQQTVEKVCPVCKVSPGTCSFNCNCGAVVCAKCFNDIMNVYNFKRCPICKMEYKPLPKKKKAKKQKNKK